MSFGVFLIPISLKSTQQERSTFWYWKPTYLWLFNESYHRKWILRHWLFFNHLSFRGCITREGDRERDRKNMNAEIEYFNSSITFLLLWLKLNGKRNLGEKEFILAMNSRIKSIVIPKEGSQWPKRATSQLARKKWMCSDADPFPGSQDPSLGLDIFKIYGSFHIK